MNTITSGTKKSRGETECVNLGKTIWRRSCSLQKKLGCVRSIDIAKTSWITPKPRTSAGQWVSLKKQDYITMDKSGFIEADR